MSKPATIGLTAAGPNEALSLIPAPTEEEQQKLFKSAMRLVCRHGWDAFAMALASVCQEGAKHIHTCPEAAAIWARRAQIVRELVKPS